MRLNFIKRNFNKAKVMVVVLVATGIFPADAQSSNSLDAIVASLNNADLYVAPIIRGVAIARDTNLIRSKKVLPMFTVSSLDQPITEVATFFSTDTVLTRLFFLLNDPEKDFYANALLYELVDNRKLAKLLFLKRDEWIKNGMQKYDIDFWQQYFYEHHLVEGANRLMYY